MNQAHQIVKTQDQILLIIKSLLLTQYLSKIGKRKKRISKKKIVQIQFQLIRKILKKSIQIRYQKAKNQALNHHPNK